jgi:prepilin peptidase CpaA
MFAGSAVQLIWGAVFTGLLLAGCVTDIRARRIPNELVLAILLAGIAFSVTSGIGLAASLGGCALGFAIWILFHLFGVIGAGDVKFFAAAGAWLGPVLAWKAALIAALAGGVLAILFLLREQRLGVTLRRLAIAVTTRSLAGVRDASGNSPSDRRPLPYGVALAVGALVAAWLPR